MVILRKSVEIFPKYGKNFPWQFQRNCITPRPLSWLSNFTVKNMRINNPHCFAVAVRSRRTKTNQKKLHELRNNLSNSPCSLRFTRKRTFGRMLALFRRTCNVGSTRIHVILSRHVVSYVQGQSPSPKVREYFYYIDHQGQVLYILHYFVFFLPNFI